MWPLLQLILGLASGSIFLLLPIVLVLLIFVLVLLLFLLALLVLLLLLQPLLFILLFLHLLFYQLSDTPHLSAELFNTCLLIGDKEVVKDGSRIDLPSTQA